MNMEADTEKALAPEQVTTREDSGEDAAFEASDPELARGLPGRPSSIVTEVVVSMTILLIAGVILTSAFVSYSFSLMTPEYALEYAPYVIIPYIILFGIIVAVYGWRLIGRSVARPLRDLVEATHKLADGDFSYRVRPVENNELGQLAEAFNVMTGRLETNRWELLTNLEEMKRLNANLARTQRELLASEKLASVGRLAAGIAHEIGNPLAAIAGYLDILNRRKYLESNDLEMVERIQAEVARINEIIRELLDYSRPQNGTLDCIYLNESIESTLTLMSTQKGFEKVELKTEFGDIPLIRANRSSMQQLIMNLVINAVHAMPDGGSLTITARPQSRDQVAGLELLVADTGIGIDPEAMDRIYDPFFTTKEPGQGTGLGLSICLRIVENNHGKISVQSEPGKGTVFRVWFPAAVGPDEKTGTKEDGG